LRRLLRIGDRLGQLGKPRRRQPLVRQFIETLAGSLARDRFESFADVTMDAGASGRAQSVIERRVHQRVREDEAVLLSRDLGDKTRGHCLVDAVEHLVVGLASDLRQQWQIEFPPDRRTRS
jgi:hypothetical protein